MAVRTRQEIMQSVGRIPQSPATIEQRLDAMGVAAQQAFQEIQTRRQTYVPWVLQMRRMQQQHEMQWKMWGMRQEYRQKLDFASRGYRAELETMRYGERLKRETTVFETALKEKERVAEADRFWRQTGEPLLKQVAPELKGVRVETAAELGAVLGALQKFETKEDEAAAVATLAEAFPDPTVQAIAKTGKLSMTWTTVQFVLKQRAAAQQQQTRIDFARKYEPSLVAGLEAGLTISEAASRNPARSLLTIQTRARQEYRGELVKVTRKDPATGVVEYLNETAAGKHFAVHDEAGNIMPETQFVQQRVDEARRLGLLPAGPGAPAPTFEQPAAAPMLAPEIRTDLVPATDDDLRAAFEATGSEDRTVIETWLNQRGKTLGTRSLR